LAIVTGATIYHLRIKHLEAEPSLISKVNTVVQIVLVIAVVLDQALIVLPALVISGLIWVTLATTLLSGFDYVWVWSRRAASDRRSNP
jgi:cardiolipin synthase